MKMRLRQSAIKYTQRFEIEGENKRPLVMDNVKDRFGKLLQSKMGASFDWLQSVSFKQQTNIKARTLRSLLTSSLKRLKSAKSACGTLLSEGR